MGILGFKRKITQQSDKQKRCNRQQMCTRCKKEIVGHPAAYTYAYNIAGSFYPPLCKKCSSSMSFSIKFNLVSDGEVFNFASIYDEMITIRVWVEKNDGNFIIKKKHYILLTTALLFDKQLLENLAIF